MVVSQILADTSYINIVLASEEERHRIFLFLGIVHELDTLALADSLLELFDANRFLGFDPNGFAVAAERWNTHAGGRAKGIGVHDLTCFVVHLHFLLGVSVFGEDVNLRDDVVGKLVGKLLDGDRLAVEYLAILRLQFLHGCGSRT